MTLSPSTANAPRDRGSYLRSVDGPEWKPERGHRRRRDAPSFVKRALWCGRRAIDTRTRVQLGSRDAAVYAVPSPSACCQTDCPASPLTPRRRHPGCGFQMAGESAGPNGSGRWSWRGSHAGPADRLMPEARRLRASRNAEPLERWLPGREAANNFAGSLSGSSSCYRQARDHQTPTAPRRKYGGASAVSPRQRRCAGRCL
jgi:hypothetical protein